ncbi:hypothetical protein CNEO3_270061 [Clostridium neonatale]|nr:hypothetical protein CNEO3_270061 [Clostridium neonatale]CAI3633861.1 hypothetical protein CNEO3_270061 [Clostridium neonatale]CAI3640468.1 hypothetical protein CNEO3_290060 [Clostridium neonatale]CAI3647622.1 hypothetical protein CNEO3_290060 [Clostridium neonatale]CAI3650302.1 hypothetical protein CNEO3_320061 [Clostridium neonatale]
MEELRYKLGVMFEKTGKVTEEILIMSQKLDKHIVEEQRKWVQLHETWKESYFEAKEING